MIRCHSVAVGTRTSDGYGTNGRVRMVAVTEQEQQEGALQMVAVMGMVTGMETGGKVRHPIAVERVPEGWTHANRRSKSSPRTGPRIRREKYVPLSTRSISSRQSIRKFVRKHKHLAAREIADASRSTNGTGYCPTIRTTIARVSSWIGSCFLPVASADAVLEVDHAGPRFRRHEILDHLPNPNQHVEGLRSSITDQRRD